MALQPDGRRMRTLKKSRAYAHGPKLLPNSVKLMHTVLALPCCAWPSRDPIEQVTLVVITDLWAFKD